MNRLSVIILASALFTACAQTDLAVVIDRVMPHVVLIRTYGEDGKALNIGTGFFIENDAGVITNWHVMRNASRATVSLNGNIYRVLRVLALDTKSDLALLETEAEIDGLHLRRELPRVGESVMVIGNPLGYESSVSTGIVSAVRRSGDTTTIQITAPISPGSSGSPVVDMDGNVIGVANSTATRGQNVNFVIPSSEVVNLTQRSGNGGVSGVIRSSDGQKLKNVVLYLTNETIADMWEAEDAGLASCGNETIFLQYTPEEIVEYGGSVSGQILDMTGAPVSGVIKIDGITERTDPNGVFRISGLFPGSYKLRAESSAEYVEEDFSVGFGEEISVLPVLPMTFGNTTDENLSYFYVKGVPSGRYDLFVRGERDDGTIVSGCVPDVRIATRPIIANVTLSIPEPASISIDMQPGVETKVIVTLKDRYGQPVGSGYEMRFFTTSGRIVPEKAVTDGTGRAFAVLLNGENGKVTVTYQDRDSWAVIYDIKNV
jgi:hypothetical protein